MKKCLVIGAGNFEEEFLNISKEDFVIACDGGLKYIYDMYVTPNLIIGDMDSLTNKEILDKFKEKVNIITLPKEKDDTDMLAGIRCGLDKGYKKFEIYGALGGRLDHTLANIQCLNFLKENGANGIIIDKNKSIELLYNEERHYKENQYGMLSAFAFGGQAKGVTEKGLKYEVSDATLDPSFPIGVSNEFTGKESSISVKTGKLLIYIEKRAQNR